MHQEVSGLRDRIEELNEEITRLKTTIVNKDSQNQSMEDMLKAERERREGENGEIRNLFYQEQEKAI